MWGRDKTWLHYQRNVIAADIYSAVFLSAYMKHAIIQKIHTWQMEVLDLQRYRLITRPHKVHAAIKDRGAEPFVFFVGKN